MNCNPAQSNGNASLPLFYFYPQYLIHENKSEAAHGSLANFWRLGTWFSKKQWISIALICRNVRLQAWTVLKDRKGWGEAELERGLGAGLWGPWSGLWTWIKGSSQEVRVQEGYYWFGPGGCQKLKGRGRVWVRASRTADGQAMGNDGEEGTKAMLWLFRKQQRGCFCHLWRQGRQTEEQVCLCMCFGAGLINPSRCQACHCIFWPEATGRILCWR